MRAKGVVRQKYGQNTVFLHQVSRPMDSGMHCVVGIFNLDITYATKIDFWSFLSSGRERLLLGNPKILWNQKKFWSEFQPLELWLFLSFVLFCLQGISWAEFVQLISIIAMLSEKARNCLIC
jgi:hypothetical membrane protein